MKTIKNRKLITATYASQVGAWIKEHQEEFFAKENEADSWGDFILWPDKKTDRDHLILKGEVCIIDRLWGGVHTYMICQFYGDCRKVHDLYPVVAIDELQTKLWKNGYFLIPDLSTQQSQKGDTT